MTTADADTPRSAAPERFSSTNLAVLAVWLELTAAGALASADAWLRAHSMFVEGSGSATQFQVTPASGPDEAALRAAQPAIEGALERHAGHLAEDWHRTTLHFEICSASAHPAPDRYTELCARLDDAIAAAGAGDSNVDAMREMRDALRRGRVGRAGSESVGTYDVILVPDLDDEARASLERQMQRVSDGLWARFKQLKRAGRSGTRINNLAPVAADLSTAAAMAQLARSSQTPRAEEREIVVGVITPGGDAAPRDVLGKLEQHAGVRLVQQTVRRGHRRLTAEMVRAVDTILLDAPDAIVVGYGGNDWPELNRVMVALQAALEGRTVPTYAGIGHRNYDRAVNSPHVTMCGTPADAAELFAVEVLSIPRRRAVLVQRATGALVRAVGIRPSRRESSPS